MKSPEALINLYRRKGMRITPQRRMIFELLSDDESHLTVDRLYHQLKERMPDVSLATVYNTIHELVALGEIHNIEGRHVGGIRYDTIAEPHHHLYCTQCHKLTDVPLGIEPSKLIPQDTAGYQIKRAQITFYGLCKECQNGSSNA